MYKGVNHDRDFATYEVLFQQYQVSLRGNQIAYCAAVILVHHCTFHAKPCNDCLVLSDEKLAHCLVKMYQCLYEKGALDIL